MCVHNQISSPYRVKSVIATSLQQITLIARAMNPISRKKKKKAGLDLIRLPPMVQDVFWPHHPCQDDQQIGTAVSCKKPARWPTSIE